MAKLLDKLFNRVIEGELLELSNEEIAKLGLAKASQLPSLSEAINLGAIEVEVDDTDPDNLVYSAFYSKSLTKAEYNAISNDGLLILMFNTTCVMLPYTKQYDNRFVVNAIYNADGESMVVRAKLTFTAPAGQLPGILEVDFDSSFAQHLYDLPALRPYGIVKFLSI